MNTRIILVPLTPLQRHTLGAVLVAARIQAQVRTVCDETYGEENEDWKVETDLDGVCVFFKDPKTAMRFKLAWRLVV